MTTLTYDYDSIGGLYQCWAIPADTVTAIQRDPITGHYSPTLSSTSGIISIPMLSDQTFSFTEEHGRDDNGDYWQPTIVGIIPKADLAQAADIEKLERGDWVILCEDQNGALRLCGDSDTPLTISTSATSGTAYIDRNGCTFTATGKLGHPSYLMEDSSFISA